jgi:hypothetical protein
VFEAIGSILRRIDGNVSFTVIISYIYHRIFKRLVLLKYPSRRDLHTFSNYVCNFPTTISLYLPGRNYLNFYYWEDTRALYKGGQEISH